MTAYRPAAAATAVAADTRALITVGLVSLLGLVILLSPNAAWLPAT